MRIPREPKATRLHEYTKERTKRKLKATVEASKHTAATRSRRGQPGTDNDRSHGLAPKVQHQQSIFHTSAQQSWFSIFRGLYGNKRTMKHVVDDHPLQHHSSATTAGSKAGKTASTASVAGTHYIFSLLGNQHPSHKFKRQPFESSPHSSLR
ncbi:hypothetical protein Nepgr_027728 [Nepenthes gracilis]|uniref:Uncharacterized protein n=1 Tax=Nepenthes gracilis TaxID=150966 RepID=A0AAD3TAC1_NEPGR|nr:hypothetical protein Nepgr_027728 [Nepenthes gracilis]